MNELKKIPVWINVLMLTGFLLLIWLMIYGNLDGNLGFDVGTQGYNDTQGVITNYSAGATSYAGFAVSFFTILAVVTLIVIILVLLYIVMKLTKSTSGSKGGYTSS